MKNKLWLFIGLFVTVIALFVFKVDDSDSADEKVTTLIVEDFSVDNVVVNIEDEPFVTEEEFQAIMHRMTHQKVYADIKWGEVEASPENVKFLIEVLERDGSEYKHTDFYRSVLDEWKKGDFSNAVKVHNKIWKWQDGNIGKAKRLLTPEEEQEYVNLHFK